MEEKRKLTVTEQVKKAAKVVNELFVDPMPQMPEDATLESLWKEICTLRSAVKKPKKVDAIKRLLEDDELTGLPIALIADIIRRVFEKHGLKCETSESSIRWYVSQKTLVWDIKPRDKLNNTVDQEV